MAQERKDKPQSLLGPTFEGLGEDIILSIFSFVGVGTVENNKNKITPSRCTNEVPPTPTKNGESGSSNSTKGVLPCGVSKAWKEFAEHAVLWKQAILRQLKTEPHLWMEGLLKLVEHNPHFDHARRKLGYDSSDHNDDDYIVDDSDDEAVESLLDRVHVALQHAAYKSLFRDVVHKHIRQVLPVFYMPGHVLLGGSYRLHLFEPRYRLLVAEMLKGYPQEAKLGGPTNAAGRCAPLFIHANRDPFGASSPACLVQMVRCNISPRDGTADIMLMPVAYVTLENIWIRPNSGNLYYAESVRMGHKATREIHELINRETLDSVVSRFEGYYTEYGTSDDDDEDFDDDFWE